jgi:hypothetical protein
MRTEPFHMTLDVDLTEEERNLRGRQATRQVRAIETQEVADGAEEARWKTRKKEMADNLATMRSALSKTSREAETGIAERPVLCRQILRGVMVEIVRAEGPREGEHVDDRGATEAEMRAAEKAPRVPGGGAATVVRLLSEMELRIEAGIAKLCERPRAEAAVYKALVKEIPEATHAQIRSAIERLVKTGALDEGNGKLVWLLNQEEPDPDPGFDDDRQPAH